MKDKEPPNDGSETPEAASPEFEEVDVTLNGETNPANNSDITETEAEMIPSIPKEWEGKSDAEIALLFEIRDLKAKLDATQKEWFEKYARLQAEFENFRKRSLKERDTYNIYASSQLISQLLPILDSADMMLKNLEPKLDFKEFQGIQMFIKQLYGVLEKEGLTQIKAEGEQFDPFVHEILSVEYTDEHPDEKILEVIQKGYRFKDRVLRSSKVKIAKPIPKPEPKPDSQEKQEGNTLPEEEIIKNTNN